MRPDSYRIAQLVYNSLTGSALIAGLPLLLASLARHKRRATAAGRLGFTGPLPPKIARRPERPIWVHALSVGEVQSAEPLVRALKERQTAQLVFSASTFAGHATALRLYSELVDSVIYFPYDLLFSVKKVLTAVDPRLVIIVETDIWPNFLYELQKRRIPAALVNARLSERSLKGYCLAGSLLRPAMQAFGTVCVQAHAEAARFQRLGVAAERIHVTGSLKFDQPIEEDFLRLGKSIRAGLGLGEENLVLVAGSTHAGEEEPLLQAMARLQPHYPRLRLIIAPRHPQRAASVAAEVQRRGMSSAFISRIDPPPDTANFEVAIVNALGILRPLYAVADIAFVGGSLIPEGGHNPLEPAAMAKPILFGPYMHSCADVADRLEQAGAAWRVHDAAELETALGRLLGDAPLRHSMGAHAQSVLRVNRGAAQRTLAVIEQLA